MQTKRLLLLNFNQSHNQAHDNFNHAAATFCEQKEKNKHLINIKMICFACHSNG